MRCRFAASACWKASRSPATQTIRCCQTDSEPQSSCEEDVGILTLPFCRSVLSMCA